MVEIIGIIGIDILIWLIFELLFSEEESLGKG